MLRLFWMRDQLADPISVAFDGEVESPVSVNAGLPEICAFIVFFWCVARDDSKLSARNRSCFSKARCTDAGESLSDSMAWSDSLIRIYRDFCRLFLALISLRMNAIAPSTSNGPWKGPFPPL